MTELERCREDIDMLTKALFGNGQPSESIAVRLLILERRAARSEKIGWLTFVGVVGMVSHLFITWVG